MFLIYGIRRKLKALGQLGYGCSCCGRHTSHTAYTEREWFTLFFIPLIPFRKGYGLSCNVCGRRLRAINTLLEQFRNWERTGKLEEPAQTPSLAR
jgi:hypothetical protein